MNDGNLKKDLIFEVLDRLSPEARFMLDLLAKSQKRSPEEVLEDEIKKYISGQMPSIDLESITKSLQNTAYQTGYWIGSIKNFIKKHQQK